MPSRWWAALVALGASQVPWRAVPIAASTHSGWTSAATMVITNPAALRAAWPRLFEGARPPELPHVDFASRRVVIVAVGSRSTGGYTLHLDSAAVVRDSAAVWVTLLTPPPGCGVSQELTAPAVAFTIPRLPAPLRVVTAQRPGSAGCSGHT